MTADQVRAETTDDTRAQQRFPSHPLLLIAFVVGAAIALLVQVRFIPLDAPIFGLFKNQVDLDVYRAGAQHPARSVDGDDAAAGDDEGDRAA